jgi:hypothetical protein
MLASNNAEMREMGDSVSEVEVGEERESERDQALRELLQAQQSSFRRGLLQDIANVFSIPRRYGRLVEEDNNSYHFNQEQDDAAEEEARRKRVNHMKR